MKSLGSSTEIRAANDCDKLRDHRGATNKLGVSLVYTERIVVRGCVMGNIARRVLTTALLLLTSCSTNPQEEYAKRVALEQQDDQTCLSYGLDQGSPAFAQCRMQLAQIRAEQDQNAAARNARVGNAMQGIGNNLMRQGTGQ